MSKPAGLFKNPNPVAMFLFSKLYAVVLTINQIANAKKPITNVW